MQGNNMRTKHLSLKLIFNPSGRATVIGLALTGAATFLIGTTSRAEMCSAEKFYNGTTFRYSICNVSDLDQRRDELPPFTAGLPNGGKMYCAPTSAMNWMTYIANHGYPGIMPGPGYWGPEPGPSQPQYNTITSALAQMGSLMGTDPVDGTKGGMDSGIEAWLGSFYGVGDFVVCSFVASGSYSPVFADMALLALGDSLVIPVIGWYKTWEEAPEEVKEALLSILGYLPTGFYRNGGHVLSMAKAKNDFQFQQIGFRDPASDNGSTSDQSPFVTDIYHVVEESHNFDGESRTQSKVEGIGTHAFLDAYHAIIPKYGLAADQNFIIFIKPIFLQEEGLPPAEIIKGFASATGGNVTDLAIHPSKTKHPYLVENDNTIYEIDALTGRSTRFATVGNPKKIVFGGREQRLHVLLPNHVMSLGLEGRQQARTHLDEPLADIAYDTKNNRLIGVSQRIDKLYFFDSDLNPAGVASLPAFGWNGPVSMSVDPKSGVIWLHCDGSPRIARVVFEPQSSVPETTELMLQGASQPMGLTVDDQSHLFVSDGGRLAEYDGEGRTTEGSRFSGLRGGQSIDILRAFTNFDPRTMTDVRYRNVLPSDVE
jgi:hypothetical protein